MLKTGDVLQDRYRVVALLGQGGMGAVYRAWDTRLNIPVALKEMVPQPELDPSALAQLRDQFEREATVLARMSHVHLVRVTDFFEQPASGNAYLVMDFVAGESLANLIERRGPLPETEVVAWAGQLLDALGYCHGQGVLHRDIKPQNVIIRPGGQAVLVDFGLVKLWDPADPDTRTAMRGMGTPEYSPPEQYGADGGHTDPSSDLYSLGACLYHALTGRVPPSATLRIADPGRLKPVRGLAPRVSAATEVALMRALELVQAQRWQSARQMAMQLTGASSDRRPTGDYNVVPSKPRASALPDQRPPVPARRRKGIPVWIWVGGAILLITACVVVLTVTGLTVRQARVAATDRAQETALARARSTSTAEAAAAQATATLQARLHAVVERASGWPPVLQEDFAAAGDNWGTGEYSDDRVTGSRTVADGVYRWEAEAHDDFVWWWVIDSSSVADLYLAVDARWVSGVPDGQFGLIFRRADRDNYFMFRLRDDRHYQLRMRYEGEWDTLVDWTETEAIRAGETNRLVVVAEGPRLTFFINDVYVGKHEDSRILSGDTALVIGLSDEGDSCVVEFDNFDLRAP